MRIATWNINSVRLRLEQVLRLIKDQNINIICLQETKTQDEYFPYDSFKKIGMNYFVDTGSPHLVMFNQDLEKLKIEDEFIKSQVNNLFKDDGVNVNFVSRKNNNTFLARTFERGVNAETLSCGTGAVAIAICAKLKYDFQNKWVNIVTKGGNLTVNFKKDNSKFIDIFLEGNAKRVFDGTFYL